MLKRIIASAAFLILAATGTGWAQTHRVEASVYAGWTFLDGVSGQTIIAGDGQTYNRVDPKDSGVFGLSLGYLVNENAEVGFQFTTLPSELVLGGVLGSPDRDLGSLKLLNYHGYFSYNFGVDGSRIRPFAYGGLGASHFGSVDFNTPFRSGTIGGNTQFSTTWGVGAKYYVSPKVGIRLAFSWTPSYIKSDATGYWCDPFWGCYLVGDPQYSNQFHLTGGATFGF